MIVCKASRDYLRKAPRRGSIPLRHPCPHRLRTTRPKRCSALTRRHLADFASHFPILQRLKMVCHAGVADVPCRRGKRAVPAWQRCRAGVAKVPCRRGKPLGRMLSRKGASRKWLNALSCSLYAFSHFVNHFLRPSALSSPVSRVLLTLSSHSFAQPNAIVRSLGAQMHSSGTEGSRREARSLSLLRVLKAAHAWCTAFCAGLSVAGRRGGVACCAAAGLSPLLRLCAPWFQRACGHIPHGSIC